MRILSLTNQVVDFDPGDSDEVVLGFIQRCEDRDEVAQWRLCFAGFDDDSRELIEIPAAREFAKRLIRLGLLVALRTPEPGKSPFIVQSDPALDGFGLHAISCGHGEVKRRGKRVSVESGIDIPGYFTDLLKTLEERKAPLQLIAKVKEVIKVQSRFDPLRGTCMFATESAFANVLRQQPPSW